MARSIFDTSFLFMQAVENNKPVDIQQMKLDREFKELVDTINPEQTEVEKEESVRQKIQEIRDNEENPKTAIIEVSDTYTEEESPLYRYDQYSGFETIDDNYEQNSPIKMTIVDGEKEPPEPTASQEPEQNWSPLSPTMPNPTQEPNLKEPTVRLTSFTSIDTVILPLKNKYYRGSPDGPTDLQELLDTYISPKMYKMFRLVHPEGRDVQLRLEKELRSIREKRLENLTESYIQTIEEREDWDEFNKDEQDCILEAIDAKCLAWQEFFEVAARNIPWFRKLAENPHYEGQSWDPKGDKEFIEAFKNIAEDIDFERSKHNDYREDDFRFAHEVAPFNFMESVQYSIWWN